jgi:hypothetical protein
LKDALGKKEAAGQLSAFHGVKSQIFFTDDKVKELEDVLLAKGYKPNRGKRQGKKYDEEQHESKGGESPKRPFKPKGPTNGYTYEGVWRKCFKCMKDCCHGISKCDCPCSSHLMPTCPVKAAEKAASVDRKPGANPNLASGAAANPAGGQRADLGFYTEQLYGHTIGLKLLQCILCGGDYGRRERTWHRQ